MSRAALERLAIAFLAVAVLVYAVIGLAGLVIPVYLMWLVDLPVAGPDALNEMRAVYGGQMLGMALVMAIALRTPRLRFPAIGLFAIVTASMALTRAVSWLAVDGPPIAPPPYVLLGMETLGALGGAWLCWARRQQTGPNEPAA